MMKPLQTEDSAWDKIAQATNQTNQFFDWCREVLEAQLASKISIPDAAGMICPRQEMIMFSQLEQNADAQIVMDYASGITDGAAYLGAEDSLLRDWGKLSEIVSRH